jgi:inward rectifier potassium channel
MRNRWYHRPFFHSPALGLEKRASWIELFYDLIFVAAFIQLGNSLGAHVSVAGALAFAAVFIPLWVAWTGFTFYQNRYSIDDFVHRLCVFAQMFAVGGMALGAGSVLDGDYVGFALSAGAAQLIVGGMYMRSYRQVSEGKEYAGFWGSVFLMSGVVWLGSALLPAPYSFALWAVATALVFVAPLTRYSLALADRFPIDFEHLGERYALLTLIVLGESFVKVLSALSAEGQGSELYAESGVLLIITCAIWWIYFDDVAGTEIRHGRARWVIWLYGHIPLQMSITGVGVATKKALDFTFEEPAPDKYRWLLAGFLALVLFSVAALDSVTERRNTQLSDRSRVMMRVWSGAVVLLLAPAGRAMSGGLFLTLLTSVMVAQVAFDMMMAPLEESAHAEHNKRTFAEVARDKAPHSAQARTDVRHAVRKGAPAELRSDLYFFFLDGGWLRVFVSFGCVFVLANVFFAALYLLEPGSINNARENSFADAFFFSVQTMSTVGYGALSPASDYGNTVVTLEAATSMILLATTTGLVFAKLSRPKSGALFSAPIVITTLNGKPSLVFRIGNARGNEVVDASLDLVLLKDEISPEGIHMRRLHDLKLIRGRTPMFILTWTVVHVIDEQSPLFGVDFTHPERHIASLVATLIGHDGTYGQTIYARKVYYPEDLRPGHRFVDVIELLEDGRTMINYDHFHDTLPDQPVSAQSPA